MNRDQFLRALRKYCRKNNIELFIDQESGKGSHYRVRAGGLKSTVQMELNPRRIERILKQLGIDPRGFP